MVEDFADVKGPVVDCEDDFKDPQLEHVAWARSNHL